MKCFNCGEEGHTARVCSKRADPAPAVAGGSGPSGAAAAAELTTAAALRGGVAGAGTGEAAAAADPILGGGSGGAESGPKKEKKRSERRRRGVRGQGSQGRPVEDLLNLNKCPCESDRLLITIILLNHE
ncbi:hypothetical protein EYF80_044187 [Liparis tanakae]|uniref:CCHC-type domain-containing protein n=1 Tax=Liparis tanakae TaxID=230148 RepID=A0A4Z2FWL2_9TELE|nr:hypothetical protein EYF80_044187 [Liparis tanakae]